MNANEELARIERRQRRADARFRGEHLDGEEAEKRSAAELLLGGALIGLLIVAVIGLLSGDSDEERNRRR